MQKAMRGLCTGAASVSVDNAGAATAGAAAQDAAVAAPASYKSQEGARGLD